MHKKTLEFRNWLKSEIETLRPGTKLMNYREMAVRWKLSGQTVRSTIQDFSKQGLLTVTQGRGIFLPIRKDELPQALPEVNSSSMSVADAVYEFICSGTYRVAEALPSVKYLSHQFGVSRSTVISAYRQLRERGHVTKIGKTFWVGGPGLVPGTGKLRECCFLCLASENISRVLNFEYWAPAYKKMFRDLSAQGYKISFVTVKNANELKNWIQGQSSLPAAILIYRIQSEEMLRDWISELKWMAPILEKDHVQCVLNIGKTRTMGKSIPNYYTRLSHGHALTSMMRNLAEYLVKHGYHRITLFFDEEQGQGILWLVSLFRIYPDLKSLVKTLEFKVILRLANPNEKLDQLKERIGKNRSREQIEKVLSKYRPITESDIFHLIHSTNNIEQNYPELPRGGAWIFCDAKNASQGYQWCKDKGYSIPDEHTIITLQDSPDCYASGVSVLVPDWDRIGYLMAHALIGDFKVPLSSKGFIRTSPILHRRLTTGF